MPHDDLMRVSQISCCFEELVFDIDNHRLGLTSVDSKEPKQREQHEQHASDPSSAQSCHCAACAKINFSSKLIR